MKGLSPRNLGYMKAFAEAWPEEPVLQQPVQKLPWGHNVRILDLAKTREERLWYAQAALENGWSRNVLTVRDAEVRDRLSTEAVTLAGLKYDKDALLAAPGEAEARSVLESFRPH